MKDILDTKGLLNGIEVMLKNWDCTKLISYLATNSCAGNKLSLKDQAQQFAGNYGLGDDIKDITRIPPDILLEYNLIDCLSTWFVHNKNYPIMVQDQQLEIYETIFKPATVDIIQMQLTGMPINMRKVKAIKYLLERKERVAVTNVQKSYTVEQYTYMLKERWVIKRNAELKVKRVTINDAKHIEFNPQSGDQVRDLLYTHLGLPVLELTKSKQPSTKAKVLEVLKNHTTDPLVLDLLQRLCDYAAVAIILSTFIPAMENSVQGPDGWHYMFGNFNLGGTLSGRLSSSKPNLQNIPATSIFAKWIKYCFQAPPGWVFCGLDFASLEDKISAKTTKDPNKIKVYTDGYDGHCLRTYYYYTEHMVGIDPTSVESINSIASKYKSWRSKSKNPTFTLTYQGTWNTLVVKYNFTPELAKLVEARYHEMYKVSDDWVAAKLDQAMKDGYITVAFGLRVRTPLLKQVIRGTSKTPFEAEAEGRTAGNALGQSWCLLNSRACSEFMERVRKEKYHLDIRPCAHIHDAQYYLIRDDVAAIAYTNEHLVNAVFWQDHPDIKDDLVPLGGELSIFYPTWAEEIVIPNGAREAEIISVIDAALKKEKKA
jgi:DNA polymerase-1